ncbi:hypothetical protein D3C72_416510 [compost metagenome]
MKKSWICLSLVAGALLATLPASAQEATKPQTVMEPEVSARALLTPNGDVAPLFGASALAYRSGPLYMGGAGYGGARYGQSRGGMGYGGAIVGASSTFAGPAYYDARLLVGGGGGSVGGQAMGSFALEPSLGIGVILPNASKLGLTAGYLYMPNASDLSGATVGLRFAY